MTRRVGASARQRRMATAASGTTTHGVRPWARPPRAATPPGSTTLVAGRLAARQRRARWHSREGSAPRQRQTNVWRRVTGTGINRSKEEIDVASLQTTEQDAMENCRVRDPRRAWEGRYADCLDRRYRCFGHCSGGHVVAAVIVTGVPLGY